MSPEDRDKAMDALEWVRGEMRWINTMMDDLRGDDRLIADYRENELRLLKMQLLWCFPEVRHSPGVYPPGVVQPLGWLLENVDEFRKSSTAPEPEQTRG